MATGGASGILSKRQIVRLGATISADNMESIAEGYLDIDPETVKNIRRNASSSEAFNRDVIRHWANKHHENQVQTLAQLLYEAAADCGYLDPRKVEVILGVCQPEGEPPSKRLKGSECVISEVTEDDLRCLADLMRQGLKRKMKITQYPWQKPSDIDIDKLYADVTLEKLYRKACGVESKTLKHYRKLFQSSMQDEGERIVLKGDPGMGKTTLGKKITHDWIEGRFTDVSIVFFVMLKSVKPGESIENVIMNQTPTLRGKNIHPDKVRRILERFGPRCLLVLDGLDEHALGKNEDVVSILEGSKYPDCKVIVTSRPHSTRDIEDSFDTVGRVEGFTKDQAGKYVESIVDDPNAVRQILKFNPSSSRGDNHPPLYKVPILLSIMCFLVKSDKNVVEVMKSSRHKSSIYFRMVRCLYMTKKRGSSFKEQDFVRVVKSVGKLAWQTLLSGNPMFRKEDVFKEVGPEVFEWGC